MVGAIITTDEALTYEADHDRDIVTPAGTRSFKQFTVDTGLQRHKTAWQTGNNCRNL